MAKQQKCYYCGRVTAQGRSVCGYCEAKLPVVRRLLAVGAEIRLQAAKEAARRERENDG